MSILLYLTLSLLNDYYKVLGVIDAYYSRDRKKKASSESQEIAAKNTTGLDIESIQNRGDMMSDHGQREIMSKERKQHSWDGNVFLGAFEFMGLTSRDEIKPVLSKHGNRYSFVNAKGITLVGTSWVPDGLPVGLAYVSHGYAEHMGYYDKLGTAFTEAGLFVFGHDHQGHGLSGGERVNIPDFQYYVEDIFQDIDLWKQELGTELPVFLFGHSMGGLVAVLASIDRPSMFRGVILTGPLIRSDITHGTDSLYNRLLAKAASIFSPSLQGGGTLPYTTEITSNPYYVQKIIEDPLFWKEQYKARQTHATFLAMDRVAMQFGKVVVPLLVLHGSEDKLSQPEGSRLLVSGAVSEDKKYRAVVGMKHHLVLEVGGNKVIRNIVTWITLRI